MVNKTLANFAEKHPFRVRLSIKTRMELKPYLLTISLSMFLLIIALYAKAFGTDGTLRLPVLDSLLYILFSSIGGIVFITYFVIYEQEEKAIFFLDRFFRRIDLCLLNKGIRVGTSDFEKAIKAYQKTLPSSCTLKDLNGILKRTQLVLSRGAREEIGKFQLFTYSLSNAIKERNANLFDNIFSEMSSFLMAKEWEKINIIQVIIPSRKEAIRSSFNKSFVEGIQKILPYFLLFTFIVIIYVLFHIELPWIS